MEKIKQGKLRKNQSIFRIILASFLLAILVVVTLAFKYSDDVNTYSEEIINRDSTIVELNDSIVILNTTLDSITEMYTQIHKLTWDNIDYWLDYYEIEHKNIVKAQIILETANLTSKVCIENRNLFGMKEAKIRKTTALGTTNHHAFYANYIESIHDYKLWQERRYIDKSEDYFKFLKRIGYAEAKRYIQSLKTIMEKNNLYDSNIVLANK